MAISSWICLDSIFYSTHEWFGRLLPKKRGGLLSIKISFQTTRNNLWHFANWELKRKNKLRAHISYSRLTKDLSVSPPFFMALFRCAPIFFEETILEQFCKQQNHFFTRDTPDCHFFDRSPLSTTNCQLSVSLKFNTTKRKLSWSDLAKQCISYPDDNNSMDTF